MAQELIKIAVVGPESTGKSTISAQLADHYDTVWVPEFARAYCEKLTGPCTWQDEVNMFYGQLELEKKIAPLAKKILFCDTTFLTVKVWSDHTFGKAPDEVIAALRSHHYDLYLLMDIDLPWQEDPLRDFPHLREHFMQVWLRELQDLNANYVVISGQADDRFKAAVAAVDAFLNS